MLNNLILTNQLKKAFFVTLNLNEDLEIKTTFEFDKNGKLKSCYAGGS